MLVAILAIAAVFATSSVLAVRAFGLDPRRRRLAAYDQALAGTSAARERIEGIQGFAAAVAEDIARLAGSASSDTKELLTQAASHLSVEQFRLRQGVGICVGAALGGVAGLLAGSATLAVLFAGCGGFAGFVWPRAQLKSQRAAREKQVWASLPEIVDFLRECHAAGQPTDIAIETVTQIATGPVVDALTQAMRRFRMGWPLDAALGEAAEAETLDDARAFYAALAEGIRNSANMDDVLAAQVETLRTNQKIKLDNDLANREQRMLWPFVFFVLPPIAAIAGFVLLGSLKTIG